MDSPLSWRPSKLVALGITIVAVIGPVAFAMADGLHSIAATSGGSFWFPSIDFSFLPSPTDPGSMTSVEATVARTVQGLVYIATLGAYYLVLAVVIGGAVLSGVGAVRGALLLSRKDVREAVGSLREAAGTLSGVLGNRLVQAGVLAAAGIGLLLASSFRSLVVEVILFAVVVAFGVLLLGSATLAALGYASALVDALLVPPLLLMTAFLPPIAAGLLAPSIRPHVERASNDLSIWVLRNLLSVGGIDALLSRTFQFRGVEYVLMWAALLLAVGWIGGGIVLGIRRLGLRSTAPGDRETG